MTQQAAACPDCGARLSADQWSAGLCLSCLLELGLHSHGDPAGADEVDDELRHLLGVVRPWQDGEA